MTRYLLDTTALIDFSKGREPAQSRVLQMIEDGAELGICAINVAEFYAGVPPVQRAVWDEFIASLTYWDISLEASKQAGRVRYEFARKGRALSTSDTLIAAVAQERDATIITNNVRDYPMENTRLLPLI